MKIVSLSTRVPEGFRYWIVKLVLKDVPLGFR
jgi:hypothetical protein